MRATYPKSHFGAWMLLPIGGTVKYHNGSKWVASSGNAIPVGSWFTVRQETNLTTGKIVVYVDKVEVASYVYGGPLPKPPFAEIMFNGKGTLAGYSPSQKPGYGVCFGTIDLYEGSN